MKRGERSKTQGMAEAGSFRIGDSVELMAQRQRHQELAQKIRNGAVTEAERDEFLRLDNALHAARPGTGVEKPDKPQP